VREQTASGLGAGFSAPVPAAGPARKARQPTKAVDDRKLREAEKLLREAEQTERAARKRHETAGRTAARLRTRLEEALERLRAAEAEERATGDVLAKATEERSRLARRAQGLRGPGRSGDPGSG
jgi:hypothetical protein